jgi:phosphoribosylaminoimidazole carboxylase PurE protein
MEYIRAARGRGIRVLIAGAGSSAHLAGVSAAETTLPVIGVPIDSSPLSGFDSLLSVVQMPPGVPVATMGVGKSGATNAGILAAQILALSDEALAQKLADYKKGLEAGVADKSNRLAADWASGAADKKV